MGDALTTTNNDVNGLTVCWQTTTAATITANHKVGVWGYWKLFTFFRCPRISCFGEASARVRFGGFNSTRAKYHGFERRQYDCSILKFLLSYINKLVIFGYINFWSQTR